MRVQTEIVFQPRFLFEEAKVSHVEQENNRYAELNVLKKHGALDSKQVK